MHFRILLIASILIICCSTFAAGQDRTIHTAAASPPEAGTIFIYPERIALENGGMQSAERGMMFVPLNRSDKNTDVIGIEIYRFRASDKAQPGTPPIFYLHGGPSFSGLERQLERTGSFESRWQPLTDIADVVVIGQRGIGSSKPTTTIETTMSPNSVENSYDSEKAVSEYQEILAREKNYWESRGLDLRGYTILEMVEDVNDVRKAFGYGKITIWGGSFGSHWGMNVMRYRPEIVERAVLWGMEGPDHTYDHPGHLWNVYKRVAAVVENSPEFKGLIPEGGLIKAVETIVKNARENPFTVPVEYKDNQYDVLFDGESIKTVSRGYRGGLAVWAADIITMYNGDYSRAAESVVRRSVNSSRGFTTASYFVLDCGSGITPERLAEYHADPANDLLSRMNWGYIAGTPVWESDLGNEFRQNFETGIPTVIVHSTWDTSTPYENALELVPYFKNSKFVTVHRGPHGAVNAAMRESEDFRKGIFYFTATGDNSRLPDEVTMPEPKWIVPEIK